MAEALGVVASIISIAGLVKTCMNAYDYVSDAKHASEDLEKLVSSLHIQRVKFLLWCQYVGLIEVMRLEETSSSLTVQNNNLEVARLTRRIQKGYVLKSVELSLTSINRTFKESHDLLLTYTASADPSSLKKIISAPSAGVGPLTVVSRVLWSDDVEKRDRLRSARTSMSWASRTSWTLKDKRKFERLVESLRRHNEDLKDVLEMVERNQLDRQEQLLATTTPFRNTVQKLGKQEHPKAITAGPSHCRAKSIEPGPPNKESIAFNDISNFDGNERLKQLVALQQLSINIENSGNDRGRDANGRKLLLNSTSTLDIDEDLFLLPSEVPIPLGETLSQQKRLHTYCNEWPVIVEWKHYSTRVTTAVLAQLKRRVSLLTLQLRRSSQTPDFSILNCRGYFENFQRRRIGIVFDYPKAENGGTLTPISLLDRLVQDRTERRARGLGPRFQVAKALTMTFYRLHSVGWLHKSFSSDNVLFFEPADQGRTQLSVPSVCGFDFSRPDSPSELSENVPTVLLNQAVDRERRLYKHPDLDYRLPPEPHKDEGIDAALAKPTPSKDDAQQFRFRKSYDIYSLGIVLLEIGLWCPIRELCRRNESVEDFRQRLKDKIVPELIYRMGEKYCSIVEKCLNGDFGGSSSDDEAEGSSSDAASVDMKASTRWLEAFLNEAVNELDGCSV